MEQLDAALFNDLVCQEANAQRMPSVEQLKEHAEECSAEEILQENLERFAGRDTLRSRMSEDDPLRACLETSCQAPNPL